MVGYERIDLDGWARAGHCAAFRNCVQPQYCVTFDLDVTKFLSEVRNRKLSFTLAFIYAVSRCANGIEEFRYRFLNGDVVLYNQIGTCFTYVDEGKDLFKVVNVPMCKSLKEYVDLASKKIDSQKSYFEGPPGNDVFVFSSMPWVTYTHISHTDSGRSDNAVPMFDWGRYHEVNGRILMPFSVQVHHSFVDGIHIGKLAKSIQESLDRDFFNE